MTDTPTRYAVVPLPPGPLPSWAQNAVSIGLLGEYFESLPQTLPRQKLEELRAAIPPLLEQIQQFQKDKAELKDIAAGVQRVMTTMADSFENQRAAEEQEVARLAEEQEAARLAQIASELAPILGPDRQPQLEAAPDGELEIKHKVEPEKYDPEGCTQKDNMRDCLEHNLDWNINVRKAACSSANLERLHRYRCSPENKERLRRFNREHRVG